MSLRLFLVCSEFPYPPIHGGRADVWRRICALKDLGVRIQLMTWYVEADGPPTSEHMDVVRTMVEDLHVLPVSVKPTALLRRLLMLPRFPSHVSARIPAAGPWNVVVRSANVFKPQAVLLDGLYGYVAAARIAKMFSVPLSLRSHNIEHVYMKRQANLAQSSKTRFNLTLATVGLRRFEVGVLRTCSWIYDISLADMTVWRQEGIERISWLPSTVSIPNGSHAEVQQQYDIVFLGNLNTPNNVQSVKWLVNDILPLIRRQRPDVSLCIAGSNPKREVEELCRATEGVRLVANAASPWPLYRGAKVLVNPATSGSGVQIKTLEMLHFSAPVVSTSIGAQGLPENVQALMSIADTTEGFAKAVVGALSGKGIASADRSGPLRVFGPDALEVLIKRLPCPSVQPKTW